MRHRLPLRRPTLPLPNFRRPLTYVYAAGIATALACGGAGGGSGSSNPYSVGRVVFTANMASTIRFAPDGRLFFCELKAGRVRIVQNGTILGTSFAELPVATAGEQGLLGLAFDPNYAQNGFVYVFYSESGTNKQKIVRFTDVNNVGTSQTTIVDNLPIGTNHCGGRIGFGSDGNLYVTVGDAGNPADAQDDDALAGKLLRYAADGQPALGNPIAANPMYAKGLRNPFGLAFHLTSGRPYVTENGPSCDDELNRITAGGNFGWRVGQPCNDDAVAFPHTLPIVRFGSNRIAPTGATFYNGSDFPEFAGDLFFGSFNDGAIRRYRIEDANGSILQEEVILSGRSGGVIDVTQGPDGGLYFCDGTGIYKLIRG